MKHFIVTAILLACVCVAIGQTTQEEQASLTPDQVLQNLMDGNARFVLGELNEPDIKKERTVSANGQFPQAVILSCLDSRVPVEMVFDQGIGDIFVGRVAGNVVNVDQLGSMEFATAVAGAKLILVLGHSRCGAVMGACDGVELGNITALLAKIVPAVDAVEGFTPEERNSANGKFVEEVTAQNVRQGLADIREGSSILAELEASGEIKIVGGLYDLHSGKVTLLD